MKKIIFALWLGCWALVSLAQHETITIKKVKKGEEPKAVMDALTKDFPNSITEDLSFLPAKLYGDEWNVQVEGEADNVNFYEVRIKQSNKDYKAVYDKQGHLLSSKQVIHDVKLPPAITTTLKKFVGWHVDKTHEIIKYSGENHSVTYRVKLQKGAEHKIIYLDRAGNIIDTRFTVI